MKHRHLWLGLVGLTSCLTVVACGLSGVTGFGDLFDSGSNANSNDGTASDDTSVGDVTDVDNSNDNSSIGDVTSDPDAGTPNPIWPYLDEAIRARVRNESALRANVTLWFVRDDAIAHSAFLHVRSGMITTVESRRSADTVEASGFNELGDVLDSAEFVFGVDFDESTPAEYIIPADMPDEPIPDDVPPPTIKMLAPGSDVSLPLGSTLIVQWTYTTAAHETLVRIYMQRADSAGSEGRTQVGSAVAAASEATAGTLSIILQDIDPGLYRIEGEIDDGRESSIAVAPGRVEVVEDEDNVAPSIEILSPLAEIQLYEGEVLPIAWRVEDDSDNTTVAFSLATADETGGADGRVIIGTPVCDDPGGDGVCQAELTIADVRPGLYDLVGEIDDGELVGTYRVAEVVRILNDEPQLEFLEPRDDFRCDPGDSFDVGWIDSDDNDNARIRLVLDPDLNAVRLDGDEVLLVPVLDEDPDAAGDDEKTVEIPAGVEKGKYRLAGTISDGITKPVYARARGLIYFGVCMPEDPQLVLTVDDVSRKVHIGGTIEVELKTSGVPHDANIRFYLSNHAYGGTVSAEMLTAGVDLDALAISSFEPIITNDGWPRRFDLTFEAEADGTFCSPAAPDSVWIRQEVEVTNVNVVSYRCPGGRDQLCPGVEVEWYGGGFEELEHHEEVEFWLSNDGSVPPDGAQDDTHRIIHRASESPGPVLEAKQVAEITLPSVIIHVLEGGGQLGCPRGLEHYKLVTVVESPEFGRIISPHPDWIGLCLQFLDSPPRE